MTSSKQCESKEGLAHILLHAVFSFCSEFLFMCGLSLALSITMDLWLLLLSSHLLCSFLSSLPSFHLLIFILSSLLLSTDLVLLLSSHFISSLLSFLDFFPFLLYQFLSSPPLLSSSSLGWKKALSPTLPVQNLRKPLQRPGPKMIYGK